MDIKIVILLVVIAALIIALLIEIKKSSRLERRAKTAEAEVDRLRREYMALAVKTGEVKGGDYEH